MLQIPQVGHVHSGFLVNFLLGSVALLLPSGMMGNFILILDLAEALLLETDDIPGGVRGGHWLLQLPKQEKPVLAFGDFVPCSTSVGPPS